MSSNWKICGLGLTILKILILKLGLRHVRDVAQNHQNPQSGTYSASILSKKFILSHILRVLGYPLTVHAPSDLRPFWKIFCTILLIWHIRWFGPRQKPRILKSSQNCCDIRIWIWTETKISKKCPNLHLILACRLECWFEDFPRFRDHLIYNIRN